MKIFTIYKATCAANGKCYVGFDSNWPARKARHEHDAKSDQGYRLHRAIRKHGWESFEWEVLYQSLDGDHCLNTMEPHFIALLDSMRLGYNLTVGGDGALGRKLSEENLAKWRARRHTAQSRAKISAACKGKKRSAETRAKIGAAGKGRKVSADQRAKLSASNTGKKRSPETRAKIRAAKLNMSPETRAKLSAAQTGKKLSAETRAKISDMLRRRTVSS